jgi:DNA-binding transcriptional regulator GbsR (MarR family)
MIKLTPVMQKFILHWGEMGTRWGINRTVAQIHALLYLSAKPLDAEEISETLSVARSNVSNSLRELQSWGIVKVVHVMGDRRDHFESLKDVWEMFHIILNERKRREVDPTIVMLKECVAESEKPGSGEAETKKRIADMLEFFNTMNMCYDQVKSLPAPAFKRFVQAADKVRKVLGFGS